MIFGIGGKLSGGKTCTGVKFSHGQWLTGKKVISNIYIKFPEGDDRTVFIRNDQLVAFLKRYYMDSVKLKEFFFNSVLLLDEIVNLIGSRRSSTALNELFTNFFMMAGKLDCDVVFTFQVKESQVDKILREVCNVYANCYRINDKGVPLVFEERVYKGKIMIAVLLEFDFDILGMKYSKLVYDPEPYYKMYDTREITLLDRSAYMRGGVKDLRKLT